MNWFVYYGDKQLLDHGSPSISSWMTAKEAIQFAHRQLQVGISVTRITAPSGEVWEGARIAELIEQFDAFN